MHEKRSRHKGWWGLSGLGLPPTLCWVLTGILTESGICDMPQANWNDMHWEGLGGLGFLLCKHIATLTTAITLITAFCFKQSPSDPPVPVLGFFKSWKGCPLAYNTFCRADKETAVFCSYYNYFQVIESLEIVHMWKNKVITMVFWTLTAFFSEKESPAFPDRVPVCTMLSSL